MSRAAIAVAAAIAAIAIVISARNARERSSVRARWANAHIERITDFAGSEVDAAISADGRLVAFLADRDSVFDAFVTQVGSGQFTNLTVGRVPQLFNEDVRNIGFSSDGSNVWIRVADIASPASVSIIPTLGGTPRPFLGTAVMAVWSPNGSKVAYHETTPGDPIYVADANGGKRAPCFHRATGIHCHHLSWSPDGRHLYFSHGTPPDEMDVWRVPAAGGPAERITMHNSRVAYPVLLDAQTLLYTATDDDGTGPWLYSRTIDKRLPERLSNSVEHYISIAASADVAGRARRLAATVSNPSVNIWKRSDRDGVTDEQAVSQVALPTARSAAPRFVSDSSILYLASRGGAEGCGVYPAARPSSCGNRRRARWSAQQRFRRMARRRAFRAPAKPVRRCIARRRTERELVRLPTRSTCGVRDPGRPTANGSPSPRKREQAFAFSKFPRAVTP
jgi:peptidyl-tRNA hydrolase